MKKVCVYKKYIKDRKIENINFYKKNMIKVKNK